MKAAARAEIAALNALTHGDLKQFQRAIAAAVMRPRGAAAGAAVGLIKPSQRLTARERLDIYHHQYWLRLLGSLRDDYPALAAALGEAKFERMARAYLARHPSRSFTLRDLGQYLETFLKRPANRALTAPRTTLALDVARFEWAQVVAFDGAALPPLTPADLAGADPARLRLRLQPHLSVLRFAHPVDAFVLSLQRRDRNRTEASQAMRSKKTKRAARPPLPRPAPTCLAIHRLNHLLYTKPLPPEAYRLLTALEKGKTVARACALAFPARLPRAQAKAEAELARRARAVQGWFATGAELGWFALRK